MSKKTAKLGTHGSGIVIQRTSTSGPLSRLSIGGGMGMGGMSSMGGVSMSRMSMGGSVRYPPGSASQVTSEQIRGVKDKNQMEKKAFQECNRKLANRLETEKFLAAQNKVLLQELENLRGKKNLDRTDIEQQCLEELKAYKTRVEDADKDKAETSAKLANLEDQVHDVNKLNETLEGDIAARIKQIATLNNQVGDLEGENGTYRRQVTNLEDEIKRLKNNIQDHKMNLDDARQNLESECKQRIAAELEKNLEVEERDFLIGILTKENEELKKLINTDVGQIDIKNLWKGEITSCIKQLQEDNDAELAKIKLDYQARYEAQMQQLGSNQMKDNANILKLEAEIKRLKNKNVDQSPMIADLKEKLHQKTCECDNLRDELAESQDRWESERSDLMRNMQDLEDQLDDLVTRFQELQDAKLTLEAEIGTYRRLLEGEEDSMDRLMTDASGARSKGADKLGDLVQSSSSGGHFSQSSYSSISGGGYSSGGGYGGSSGFSSSSGYGGGSGYQEESGQIVQSSGMGGGSQLSSSEGKVFIKKKATGPLCIDEAHGNGAYVSLVYGTKDKRPQSEFNLKGWKVMRLMEGDTECCCTYEFKSDCFLEPLGKLRIYGKKYSSDAKKGDLVADFSTWRSGGGKFTLQDPSKNEKGFLTIEFR